MRKLTLGLSLAIVLIAAPARAESFTLSSLKVDLNLRGTAVQWTNLVGGGLSFDLKEIDQIFMADLFRLSTKESSMDLRDIASSHTIDVRLALASFGSSGTSLGVTGAGFLHGLGQLVWNNPVQLSFGNGGVLALSLSNMAFSLPGSATISATLKLLQAPGNAAQIPEPSSALLVALGGGLFAMVRARRVRA